MIDIHFQRIDKDQLKNECLFLLILLKTNTPNNSRRFI